MIVLPKHDVPRMLIEQADREVERRQRARERFNRKPVQRCKSTRSGGYCDLPAGHPGFHHWRGMA